MIAYYKKIIYDSNYRTSVDIEKASIFIIELKI